MKCIVTDTDINIYSLDRWVGRFYSFCPNCFLYTLRVSELWNKNIIIQIEININDGSIKYENEFEQNYMKVKDRIYKLYTENPGFYNHIIEQTGYGDLIDFHGMCIENVPLCWKGPDYDGWLDETWFLLEGFCIENDILYAQVSNYHSGPPDFEWLDIECVPNGILEYVLNLFKEKIIWNKNIITQA